MLTIELRFLTGRYHATPWGRHVNEAVPEWPPSPYRLVRALYDVWKRKLPEWRTERVEPLLEKLAAEAPHFCLPPAGASHTRSYLHSNTPDPTDKSLIFDGFVTVCPESRVLLQWPGADLTDQEKRDLNELLRLLNFCGRSESWVAATLTEVDVTPNCQPAADSDRDGLVPVACCVSKQQFSPSDERGVPKTWFEAITYSTSQMLKDRVSQPPALQSVLYVRNSRALVAPPSRQLGREPTPVTAVLYELNGKVLPLVGSTLEVAEQVRMRFMGIHKKRMGGDESRVSPRFSGHTADGRTLEGHRHCFILPFSKKRNGLYIDRILVWCREAFDREELLSLHGLHRLWQRDGKPDVHCVPVGAGSSETFRGKARVVESTTPFVPPRHYRRGRGDFISWMASEVRRECENHKLPATVEIEPLERSSAGIAWHQFRRNRKGDPPRFGWGFRVAFSKEVPVPFSLGFGCHFGLGQFRAAAN